MRPKHANARFAALEPPDVEIEQARNQLEVQIRSRPGQVHVLDCCAKGTFRSPELHRPDFPASPIQLVTVAPAQSAQEGVGSTEFQASLE
jgi:hypothetical protein